MASSTLLSKANTTFSLDLLKKLSDEDKGGNVFFSPFSISSALAMVMLGTKGNTATQMSEVLRFTEPEEAKEEEDGKQAEEQQTETQPEVEAEEEEEEETPMETENPDEEKGGSDAKVPKLTTRKKKTPLLTRQIRTQMQPANRLPNYLRKCLKTQIGPDGVHDLFSKLLTKLTKPFAPYTLSIANRLYGEQSYQFVQDFLSETKRHYDAELESVDFKSGAEAARVNINSWVEKKTEGKIKEILVKDSVGGGTKLVLVNAIYFNGKWAEQFKKKSTVDAKFRINKNDTKPVKLMCLESKFALNKIPEINCQVLEMPYKGNDLSMTIFLPDDIKDSTTGLEKLEKELTYENFAKWTATMQQSTVEVKLPRFKMDEKYDMNKVLKDMGMVDAFDPKAGDFSGMSPSNDLVLSKVVHKSFVDVNEDGTEAAAATGSTMSVTSVQIPVTFVADHPFLFFIRHRPTMTILFAGRYCSPE